MPQNIDDINAAKKKIIEDARRLGIADEYRIRNIEIRDEFAAMKSSQMKYAEKIQKLAYKYFLTEKHIENILFNKKQFR